MKWEKYLGFDNGAMDAETVKASERRSVVAGHFQFHEFDREVWFVLKKGRFW